jgi:hypothetical protein
VTEYIKINPDEISKPIYRIISFEKLVEIFRTNQITFLKPEKWDDPYENIIAKTIFDLGTTMAESYFEPGISNNSHASCWTKLATSDAIWRIYSQDKKCVRIESTPEVISRNISKWILGYPNSKLFIGKVVYLPDDHISEKVKEFGKIFRSGDSYKAAAIALLYKRDSFENEDEIRVVVIDQDNNSKDGVLKINVDPHDVIKSVEIDSRTSAELKDVYINYLKNVLKFSGNVTKSTLYDTPRRWIYKEKKK